MTRLEFGHPPCSYCLDGAPNQQISSTSGRKPEIKILCLVDHVWSPTNPHHSTASKFQHHFSMKLLCILIGNKLTWTFNSRLSALSASGATSSFGKHSFAGQVKHVAVT
jgi:hypothetical protein